jgi:hypothetical protein
MQELLESTEETPEAPAIPAPGSSPLTCGQLCVQYTGGVPADDIGEVIV